MDPEPEAVNLSKVLQSGKVNDEFGIFRPGSEAMGNGCSERAGRRGERAAAARRRRAQAREGAGGKVGRRQAAGA